MGQGGLVHGGQIYLCGEGGLVKGKVGFFGARWASVGEGRFLWAKVG